MKKASVIFILLAILIQACSNDPTIADSFLEHGLLLQKEYDELVKEQSLEVQNDKNAIVLWILMKQQSVTPRRYYIQEVYDEKYSRKMASAFQSLELINEAEYNALIEEIESGLPTSRIQMLEWPFNYRERQAIIGPDALQRLAGNWSEIGLITPDSKNEFMAVVKADPKKAALSLPGFLKYSVSFPDEGWDIYADVESIFDSLLSLIPEAQKDDFSYRIDTVPYDSNSYQPTFLKVQIEMKIDGKTYSEENWARFPDPASGSPNPPSGKFPFSKSRLPAILNQYLRESGSTDRIVHIHRSGKVFGFVENETIWYAKIGKLQYDFAFDIMGKAPWWADDFSFEKELSRREVDSLVADLESHGFLQHLSGKEIEKGSRKALLNPSHDPSQLLYILPDLVMSVPTAFPAGNHYPGIFADLQRISHGIFHPAELRFAPVGKRGTSWAVYFKMNGKTYRDTLKYVYGEALDFEFVNILNRAVNESGDDREFAYFDYVGDYISYIFIDKKQEDLLKKWGVIREYDSAEMDID